MEHEERSGKLAKYVERRRGDDFEVMVYSGTIKVDERKFTRPSKIPRYQRILVLPLPPDFDWTKLSDFNSPKQAPHFPNAIMITEDEIRYRRKGRKKFRPLTAFLYKPGRTSTREVTWIGKIGERSKARIDKAKFMEMTKRNLYIDKYYAEPIFNRGNNKIRIITEEDFMKEFKDQLVGLP